MSMINWCQVICHLQAVQRMSCESKGSGDRLVSRKLSVGVVTFNVIVDGSGLSPHAMSNNYKRLEDILSKRLEDIVKNFESLYLDRGVMLERPEDILTLVREIRAFLFERLEDILSERLEDIAEKSESFYLNRGLLSERLNDIVQETQGHNRESLGSLP
ncbi:hypothetical protein ACOSQ3_031342 [Xanthoceras sorbifolium]